MLEWFLQFGKYTFGRLWGRERKSALGIKNVRVTGKKAAVLLVHGYTGASDTTWQVMINRMLDDPSLGGWDVLSIGYSTSLRLDVPHFWAADPSLSTLSINLATTLKLPPLSNYEAIAIVAHSMGGLIVQRCICDDPPTRARLSHLFLYGVPSLGVGKASYFGWWKRQIADMRAGSPFISGLRKDWFNIVGPEPSFVFRCIAGDRDEFVSGASSLEPFAMEHRRVVIGNHSTVISPIEPDDQRFTVLAFGLSGRADVQTIVDGAEVAVEARNFHTAVDALWETRDVLDDNARVTLALALEGVGRRSHAIEVLQKDTASSSEVLGTLAGRLKRRWLTERDDRDLKVSRELYLSGLEKARTSSDFAQVYYHAINVAFLDLMAVPEVSAIPQSTKDFAQEAVLACGKSPENVWSKATVGEANLYLEHLDAAIASYRSALEAAMKPRDIHSFVSQARMATARIFGQAGLARLERELDRKAAPTARPSTH